MCFYHNNRNETRPGHTAARVRADVRGSCYHSWPCGCLKSEAMLVSKGHTAAEPMPIWKACTATWGNTDIQTQLLQRTISGSMVLLQLGSVLKLEARVATKGYTEVHDLGTTCGHVGIWEPCHNQNHPDLSCLYIHPEPRCHRGPRCCQGPYLGQ